MTWEKANLLAGIEPATYSLQGPYSMGTVVKSLRVFKAYLFPIRRMRVRCEEGSAVAKSSCFRCVSIESGTESRGFWLRDP